MGFFKYSPQVFYMLEPYESFEIIQKARERYKTDHELMFTAISNALGCAFNKKYKYKDVFNENNVKIEVTEEERQEMKEFLNNW